MATSLTDTSYRFEQFRADDLFTFPVRTRPLQEANDALQEPAQGKVNGHLVLDAL